MTAVPLPEALSYVIASFNSSSLLMSNYLLEKRWDEPERLAGSNGNSSARLTRPLLSDKRQSAAIWMSPPPSRKRHGDLTHRGRKGGKTRLLITKKKVEWRNVRLGTREKMWVRIFDVRLDLSPKSFLLNGSQLPDKVFSDTCKVPRCDRQENARYLKFHSYLWTFHC